MVFALIIEVIDNPDSFVEALLAKLLNLLSASITSPAKGIWSPLTYF